MPESPVNVRNHGAAVAQHAASAPPPPTLSALAERGRPPAVVAAPTVPVEHALCAYAEPYIRGRRGLVVGAASSGVGERLLSLGARSVHLFDPDSARAALAPAARGLTVAALDDRALDFRDGAFQFAVVFELASVPSAAGFLSQLRRLLEAGGAVIARTAAGSDGLEYGELYDLVSLEFPHVTMVGEVGFGGVAYVELGAEAPDVTVDSQLSQPSAPRAYIAVASHAPLTLDGYAIIQLPAAAPSVSDAERERLEAGLAEVERQRTHVETLLDTLDREGEKGMRLAMELEVAQKSLVDARAQASVTIAEAMQASQEASVALQARLAAELEGQLRAAQTEFTSRIEEAEAQLLVQDAQIVRLSKDLIDAKNRLEQPLSTPSPVVDDSQLKVLEGRATAADRRAAAASTEVAELTRKLEAARANAAQHAAELSQAKADRLGAEEAAAKALAAVEELQRALSEAEKRSAGAILLAGAADGRLDELATLTSDLQAAVARADERVAVAERRVDELLTEVARADEVEGRMQRALAEVTRHAASAEARAEAADGRIAEAHARGSQADARASEAEARAQQLEELARAVEGRLGDLALAEERLAQLAPAFEQVAGEHAREVTELEGQLLERARMLKAQDVELARRARMIEDLLSALDELHRGEVPGGAHSEPREAAPRPAQDDARVAELRARLDELAAECARREGELEARAWRIQELELERTLPPSPPPAAATPPAAESAAVAALRAENERLESELFALRQGFVQEHEARLAADAQALAKLQAELEERNARIEALEGRLAAANA